MPVQFIISLDIDGTQYHYGEPESDVDSMALKLTLENMRREGLALIVHNTGRPYPWLCHGEQIQRYLEPVIAEPDYIISHGGTKIWTLSNPPSFNTEWQNNILRTVSIDEQAETIRVLEKNGYELDPETFANEFKISLITSEEKHSEVFNGVQDILEQLFPNKYDILFWNRTSVDITPKGINKSSALQFLASSLNLETTPIIVAGDSMNDLPLLSTPSFNGILVGNATDDLRNAISGLTNIFRCSEDNRMARGVLQGLEHYGVINKGMSFKP